MALSTKNRREEGWEGRWRKILVRQCMREPSKIAEEDLRAPGQAQHDLGLVTLAFLSLGHDYDAGLYRAVNERGTAYGLKATARPLYEPRLLVPRYLLDQRTP